MLSCPAESPGVIVPLLVMTEPPLVPSIWIVPLPLIVCWLPLVTDVPPKTSITAPLVSAIAPEPAIEIAAPTNNLDPLASSVIVPLLVNVVALIWALPLGPGISKVPELVRLVPARIDE